MRVQEDTLLLPSPLVLSPAATAPLHSPLADRMNGPHYEIIEHERERG